MDSSAKPKGKGKGKAKKASLGSDDKNYVPVAFYWSLDLTKKLMLVHLAYQRENGKDQSFKWGPLTSAFEVATGKRCNQYTLKNRTRDMKSIYQLWNKLKKGETKLGWDQASGTIRAPDEWWEKKIAEDSNFSRFRKKGIPPNLEDLFHQVYGGTVATGEYSVDIVVLFAANTTIEGTISV